MEPDGLYQKIRIWRSSVWVLGASVSHDLQYPLAAIERDKCSFKDLYRNRFNVNGSIKLAINSYNCYFQNWPLSLMIHLPTLKGIFHLVNCQDLSAAGMSLPLTLKSFTNVKIATSITASLLHYQNHGWNTQIEFRHENLIGCPLLYRSLIQASNKSDGTNTLSKDFLNKFVKIIAVSYAYSLKALCLIWCEHATLYEYKVVSN